MQLGSVGATNRAPVEMLVNRDAHRQRQYIIDKL
jgi:hypothetical protein